MADVMKILDSGYLDAEVEAAEVPSYSSFVGKKMQSMSLLSLSGLEFDSLPIVKATEEQASKNEHNNGDETMDLTPVESMSEDMP